MRIARGLARAKSWNGKAFGLATRIAALFHAFECMEKDLDPASVPIPLDIVINAAKLTDVLAVHVEKVFADNNEKMNDAQYLLKRIQAMGVSETSKQDLWQGTRGRFKKTEHLDEALKSLEDNGYIIKETNRTKGRPRDTIKVNPLC
jgi:hypothetical protein